MGAPLVEAMKAGAVDFGYVGSATMTFGLVSGAPLKAINVWWIRGGGSGVLVPAAAPSVRWPSCAAGGSPWCAARPATFW
ncbi:MAG: hypothetical protein WDM92_01095 [Caulobacteraceae bacterium]